VGRAAQLAYYLLLALFPALLFLTAFMGLFLMNTSTSGLMRSLQTVLPGDALSVIQKYLDQAVQGSGSELISLGLLGALWASSSGMTAIMEALNAAYDATETRPFWKVRLIGIVLTIGLAGFIILSTALVLYGGAIVEWVTGWFGLGSFAAISWKLMQWFLVIILMLFVMAVIYYVCPDIEQDWRWVTPGSVFAVGMWLLISGGFKIYVNNFGSYNVAYGSIGGVIVLLLWLYLSGIVILVGGEVNAEIAAAAKDRAI
jgi:membrane protein